MPRVRKSKPEQEVLRSSATLATQFAPPRKKSRSQGTTKQHLLELVQTVTKYIDDEWPEEDERPSLLVAMFCWAHELVYGVSCVNEVARTFKRSTFMAARLVREEFNGSFDDAVDYMRWVWRNERRAEQWRRANTGYGRILTCYEVLRGDTLLKRMRLEQARKDGVL